MANIRDVAKKAGVAASTVSRYINKSGYVSETSKEKIDRAISDLEYVPYDLNRSIIRTKIIAMVVPDISHPFFSTLIKHIEENLVINQFSLMVFSTNKSNSFISTLNSNLVDGVIIADANIDSKEIKRIKKPIIHLDRFIQGVPTVSSDHKKGGALAGEELVKAGCKSVIQICGEKSTDIPSYLSHTEFERVIKENGIDIETIEIEWSDFNFEKFKQVARDILDKNPRTDGVFGADMIAIAFIRAAQDKGLKIPRDLKVISYDGSFTSQSNSIKVTTVVQDLVEIGKKSVETVINLINGIETVYKYDKIDVSLELGETT